MGRKWGPDAVNKHLYTNDLSVGTALDESPLREGLLYAGTDDGLIQVSENGGRTWRADRIVSRRAGDSRSSRSTRVAHRHEHRLRGVQQHAATATSIRIC